MRREIKELLRSFTVGDMFFSSAFLVVLIISQLMSGFTLAGFIAAILGFCFVVLVRKGSRFSCIFGALQMMIYINLAFQSKLYGDVMLNVYTFVMQFVGWFSWTKQQKGRSTVMPKDLNGKVKYIVIVWVVEIVVYGLFLSKLGGNTPFIDAVTTMSSVVATVLSALCFKEQWYFWIICNITSVIMWTFAMFRGEDTAVAMIIMWIFYSINSLIGMRTWSGLKRKVR